MKVRVRSTAAGPWGVILAGKVGTVPDSTGRAMVKANKAEEICEPARETVAAPETATAEPEMETTSAKVVRRRRRHAEVS